MICSRCHKRPAVVFVASNVPDSEPQGYCLVCAKELGMKPMTDLIDKMGISEEQLEAMQEQFDGLMALDQEQGGLLSDDEEGDFSAGGAATFPFLQNIFGDAFKKPEEEQAQTESANPQKKKKEKKSKRKHLDTYCYNLTQSAKEGKI